MLYEGRFCFNSDFVCSCFKIENLHNVCHRCHMWMTSVVNKICNANWSIIKKSAIIKIYCKEYIICKTSPWSLSAQGFSKSFSHQGGSLALLFTSRVGFKWLVKCIQAKTYSDTLDLNGVVHINVKKKPDHSDSSHQRATITSGEEDIRSRGHFIQEIRSFRFVINNGPWIKLLIMRSSQCVRKCLQLDR